MKCFLALALLLGAACAKQAALPVPADSAAASGPARLRGTLLARDGALVMVACGTTAERTVTVLAQSQLEEALVAVTGGVRDSMYVEFLADTADGTLVARETLFASALSEGSRCDRPRYLYEFEALGTEPFWHVTLDGTQLVLERMENPLEQVFVADAPVTRGTLTTITARRDNGEAREIKLGLLREACRDGMSDAWYPYRAEVRLGLVALHGCARK